MIDGGIGVFFRAYWGYKIKKKPKERIPSMVKRTTTTSLIQHADHLFNNIVILTDFDCSVSTASVELRLRNVFHYASLQREKRTTMPMGVEFLPSMSAPEIPPITTIHDIPSGHIDFTAQALYTAFRALGRSGPNLFVHMTDPHLAANATDRAVLVTDLGNTFIGPNNGSLGLVSEYLQERGIPCALYQIDCDFIEELEQHRMEEPSYHVPGTFHGRDIFAVVAGHVAAGVDVATITKKLEGNHVLTNPFADTSTHLPLKLREPIRFFAFKDNTFGNLKTNLRLDHLSFEQLVDENAVFQLTAHSAKPSKKGFFSSGTNSVTLTARQFYSQGKNGEAIMLLGSTFAPSWDEQFVDIAVHMGNAAEALNLSHITKAEMLTLERLS